MDRREQWQALKKEGKGEARKEQEGGAETAGEAEGEVVDSMDES